MPGEGDSHRGLWHGDHDQRSGVRQTVGEVKCEQGKALLVELLVKEALPDLSINLRLHIAESPGGHNASFVALHLQLAEHFWYQCGCYPPTCIHVASLQSHVSSCRYHVSPSM
jgi:hypothetical protein